MAADRAALESLRLELQESISTFRYQATLLTQAFGFIVAADAVLISYGFAQKQAGVLLIAAAMPITMLIIYIEMLKHMAPIGYVAIQLERRLLPQQKGLVETYASTRLGPAFKHLPNIMNPSGPAELDKALRLPRFFWLQLRSSLALSCVAILQLGLFLTSLTVYHYRFM